MLFLKGLNKKTLLLALVALLVSCRTEAFYENYDESGYKEDGLTKAEFIEDFWTCEKHKKRLRKALIPIQYGYASGGVGVPDTIPNGHSWPRSGGCIVGSNSPKYAAVAKCSKCQKEYRRYKRTLRFLLMNHPKLIGVLRGVDNR